MNQCEHIRLLTVFKMYWRIGVYVCACCSTACDWTRSRQMSECPLLVFYCIIASNIALGFTMHLLLCCVVFDGNQKLFYFLLVIRLISLFLDILFCRVLTFLNHFMLHVLVVWNILFLSHCDADQSVCEVNGLSMFKTVCYAYHVAIVYFIVMSNSL